MSGHGRARHAGNAVYDAAPRGAAGKAEMRREREKQGNTPRNMLPSSRLRAASFAWAFASLARV